MGTLKKMPGHTRLYRRNATYYHRAAIPTDISETYPKIEETFSLKTKDHTEAVRLVRIAAVNVDEKFDAHRRMLARQSEPALDELTAEQIAHTPKRPTTCNLDRPAGHLLGYVSRSRSAS